MLGDMDPIQPLASIAVGQRIVLQQTRNGEIIATHPSLSEPLRVDEKQLERWLMRQFREAVL